MAWKDSSCIEVQELSQMAIESRTGRGPVQVCHIVNESLTQRAKGTGKVCSSVLSTALAQNM